MERRRPADRIDLTKGAVKRWPKAGEKLAQDEQIQRHQVQPIQPKPFSLDALLPNFFTDAFKR